MGGEAGHGYDVASLRSAAERLRAEGRNLDALKCLVRAVMLQPDSVELLCDVGDLWQVSGHFPQAIAAYQKVLELEPGTSRALYSLGCAQLAADDYVGAIESFQGAIANGGDSLEARHNLGRALYEMGEVSAAFALFEQCGAMARPESERSRAMAAVIVPGVPEADNAKVLETRRLWAERDLRPAAIAAARQGPSGRAGGKLRVGYVSSFFHRDNWMKPVWGLINQHDRERFEIHLFSDGPAEQIRHGYRRRSEDRFFETSGLRNDELAALIRERGIDLLVDLNGYSNVRRLPLFVLRPAPVIIGWFNLYATTGMEAFDYLIGDREAIPAAEEGFYAEKILRVSGSYLTFEVAYPVPPIAEAPCVGSAGIKFGCLGSQYKITPEVIDAWSRILHGTPGSSLILKNRHLGSDAARAFVHRAFEQRGIQGGRILPEGPEEHFEFLKAYDRIDLALDTFPYNGGTTTTEAIWQGVPVLTFSGDRWASRTSASILRAAGLGEFVAPDREAFIELAIRLGTAVETKDRLARFRRNVRTQLAASSACDTKGFAGEMEEIYEGVAQGRE